MGGLWAASYVALWIVVVLLVVFTMGLLRQLGQIQLRLGPDPGALLVDEGLERGSLAPEIEGTDAQAQHPVTLSAFRGRRVVVVFLSPGCVACRQLVPHLRTVARGYRGKLQFLAVCSGAETGCEEFLHGIKLQIPLIFDRDNAIAASYAVQSTPFAFLINERGTILIGGIVNTGAHLESLISEEGTYQGTTPWQPLAASSRPATGPESGVPLGARPER